jgi:hypothetical protein
MIRKDERWFVREDLEQGGYEYWPVTPSIKPPSPGWFRDRREGSCDPCCGC